VTQPQAVVLCFHRQVYTACAPCHTPCQGARAAAWNAALYKQHTWPPAASM
jgi:hypothetical protein